MTPTYLTQRTAIAMLRETGRTIEECRAIVAKLPKKLIGKREKVYAGHVRAKQRELNAPPEPVAVGIRPLSTKHRQAAKAATRDKWPSLIR